MEFSRRYHRSALEANGVENDPIVSITPDQGDIFVIKIYVSIEGWRYPTEQL